LFNRTVRPTALITALKKEKKTQKHKNTPGEFNESVDYSQ